MLAEQVAQREAVEAQSHTGTLQWPPPKASHIGPKVRYIAKLECSARQGPSPLIQRILGFGLYLYSAALSHSSQGVMSMLSQAGGSSNLPISRLAGFVKRSIS